MLKPFPASITTQTRPVCNLFQEPVKQPLLAFRIAEEEKTGRLKIFQFGPQKWTYWPPKILKRVQTASKLNQVKQSYIEMKDGAKKAFQDLCFTGKKGKHRLDNN